MTRQALILHPDSHCPGTRVEAHAIRRPGGQFALHYFVTGDIERFRLPAPAPSTRAEDLWRHTCFEAFLRAAPGEAYCEFNFAPSTQWAAYRFDAYRAGMRTADDIEAPRIDVRAGADRYELRALLYLRRLPATPWRLGLSAVLETNAGEKSYWALAHPPGATDFHHSDCFAQELTSA